MHDPTIQDELHAQIAVHLFGWRWLEGAQLWRDPDGLVCDVAAFRRCLPAYSRVPEATARVWQWLETLDRELWDISVTYDDKTHLLCRVHCGTFEADGVGPTWPEALCRAALALRAALEQGEGETP